MTRSLILVMAATTFAFAGCAALAGIGDPVLAGDGGTEDATAMDGSDATPDRDAEHADAPHPEAGADATPGDAAREGQAPCTPGDKRCGGGGVETCAAGGHWSMPVPCDPDAGTGAACVPPGVCGCNLASDCVAGQSCDPTSHACTTSCSAAQPCNGGCCTAGDAGTCTAGAVKTACGTSGDVCLDCASSCPGNGMCTCSASGACTGSVTFGYAAMAQSFVVQPGVTAVTITAHGGAGGTGNGAAAGGQGGVTTATIAVTPGETLTVYVGGKGGVGTASAGGAGGFNGGAVGGGGPSGGGGGGGGASDVRHGGITLADRIVIAGGGGGGAGYASGHAGGAGGGATGATGLGGGAVGGGGGTQTGGGVAGTPGGAVGALGIGGAGGTLGVGGGGGGGGYYGGGGGAYYYSGGNGGGGGGSSFAIPIATNVTMAQGGQVGAGQVVITW